VSNALRTALYQTIRRIQKKASRAAINHEIQSPGADITKEVQRSIYDLQPAGIQDWKVQTLNIHDEIVAVVHDPSLIGKVEETVLARIEELREKVPLLEMKWVAGPNWHAIH
jgi:DNA polymerase I-like protein with 3'-5' exonuclease and polymerase domains